MNDKWEFSVQQFNDTGGIQRWLSEQGANGWDLVNAVSWVSGHVLIFMKRPRPSESPKVNVQR